MNNATTTGIDIRVRNASINDLSEYINRQVTVYCKLLGVDYALHGRIIVIRSNDLVFIQNVDQKRIEIPLDSISPQGITVFPVGELSR